MIERPHLTTIIAIAVATIFGLLWATGDRPDWRWFSSIGAAVCAVLLSMAIFDKWLWKIPLLQGWFVNRPVLEGDWTGEIRSQWLDPDTGQNMPPIPARISIRQSFSKIHLNLETDHSGGDFVTSTIFRKEDGTYRVVGTYRNEPRLEVRGESPVHLGQLDTPNHHIFPAALQ